MGQLVQFLLQAQNFAQRSLLTSRTDIDMATFTKVYINDIFCNQSQLLR